MSRFYFAIAAVFIAAVSYTALVYPLSGFFNPDEEILGPRPGSIDSD
ncbi:MAG: hypothetical protein ACPGSI_15045 [Pikeienuella sp.]